MERRRAHIVCDENPHPHPLPEYRAREQERTCDWTGSKQFSLGLFGHRESVICSFPIPSGLNNSKIRRAAAVVFRLKSNDGIDTPTECTAALAEATFGRYGRAGIHERHTHGQFRCAGMHDPYSATEEHLSDAAG